MRVQEPQPDQRHLICEALQRAFDDLALLENGSGPPADLEVTAIDRSRSAVRRIDTGEVVFLEKDKGGRFCDELIAAVRRFRPTAAARRSVPATSATSEEPSTMSHEPSAAIAWLGRQIARSTRELRELTRWQRASLERSGSVLFVDQQLRAIERLQRFAAELQVLADASTDCDETLHPLLSWIQLRASIWRRLVTPNLTVEAHPDHHAILVRADRRVLFELLDALVRSAASVSSASEPLRVVVERVWDHDLARVRVEFHGPGIRLLSHQARTRAAILTEALGGRLQLDGAPLAIELKIADEVGSIRQTERNHRRELCSLVVGASGPTREALQRKLARHGVDCLTLARFESAVSLTQAGCRYPLVLIDAEALHNSNLPRVTQWSAEGLRVVAYSARQRIHELNREQLERWLRAGLSGLIEEPFPIRALSSLMTPDSVAPRESPLSR